MGRAESQVRWQRASGYGSSCPSWGENCQRQKVLIQYSDGWLDVIIYLYYLSTPKRKAYQYFTNQRQRTRRESNMADKYELKKCSYVFRGSFVHSTSQNAMEIMQDKLVGVSTSGKVSFCIPYIYICYSIPSAIVLSLH